MNVFLKGFYGYKNFGDEMLFFGLVNWINENYDITKLVVESGDNNWMEDWIKDNKIYLGNILDKLEIVPINQHKIKNFSHILNIIGFGKYRNFFKFFGGGEVLDDSRKFPHDGRNLALLYNHTIRKKRFVLLGGIGTVKKHTTKDLYSFVISRAKSVICRDDVSHHIAQNYNDKSILYHDFSLDIIQSFLENYKNTKQQDQLFPYILINISPKSYTPESFDKIEKFCENYPKHKKIFFPCDITFDEDLFFNLKRLIPDMEIYNWTKHTLDETLALFYNSDGGIGARLHFLYPLKVLEKNYEPLVYEEKIEKLILK